MSNEYPEAKASIEHINRIKEDVDLLQYLYALFDAKWFLFFTVVLFGGAAIYHAKTVPDMYVGVARTDIRDLRGQGGLQPDDRLMSQSMAMLEYQYTLESFKENYTQVVLIRVRSHEFVRYFMDKYNIYKHLNPEYWDEENQRWLEGFELDKGFDELRFRTEMLGTAYDEVTDIAEIRIRHSDPKQAAELANLYVDEFNEYMRRQTLKTVQNKLAYLYQQLEQTQVLEIQHMLFRLIEAQTATAMLAEVRKDYVLEMLDPAVVPYKPVSPNRKVIVIMGVMAGLLLSFTMVILVRMGINTLDSFKDYAKTIERKEIKHRRWGIRAWLYKLYRVFRWLLLRILKGKQ